MASPKHKGFARKNSTFGVIISNLKKENASLKKTLAEMCRQHSQHNKLVERFVSLESARLEGSQQHKDKVSPSEQLRDEEGEVMDGVSVRTNRSISTFSRETEEIKNKLVSVLTRCQYLENEVAQKDSASEASTRTTAELQHHLSDALEKNKQWLEYDQQREAYVRATLARMLWLEKQLNEANQALSQQHNEEPSAERERMSEMLEHYEKLLQKAKDELEMLREKLDVTHQNLITAQNWCKEKEREVEELKQQQLQSEDATRQCTAEDDRCSEDGELWLSAEAENLQCKLDEERRRSANLELQSNLAQKCLLNRHHADQKKIADLERQIKISSQDLEDEKQNCFFLNKQMVKFRKTLHKHKDRVTKEPKREQQDRDWCEAGPSCSPPDSTLNESFLECPSCQAKYPACHYRHLIRHLETCID